MRKPLILLGVILILSIVGCSQEYFVFMTGFGVSPQLVRIDEAACIYVKYNEYSSIDISKRFRWEIDGFEEDFITQGNSLMGVVFDTPGIKNVRVVVESDYKKFVGNELQFVIDVQ